MLCAGCLEVYNLIMEGFNYSHTVEVRYGDLDPQGHVNNAKYFTYLEQTRVAYIINLGLWDGNSFFEIGFILADAHISFKKPIHFGTNLRVGARVSRLGKKSLTMEYEIGEAGTGKVFSTADAILVTYDYHSRQTIPIPEMWREKISEFEKFNLSP
jgi:acyl-CoA thioester hydrolase